ncbi:hypothetical protein ACPESR_25375 [Nocardia testacea]|uniref:hypothetical protein n=1 Tax=Nocardia testacea TaxID=248551 RepID=UPI003C2AF2F3
MDDFTLKMLELQIRAITSYQRIGKVLGGLALPIKVVEHGPETEPSDLVASIIKARTALADLPMDHHAQGVLATALTDWLNAMVLVVFGADEDEHSEWAFTSAGLQFSRCEQELKIAQGVLNGEIQVERIDDEDKE